MISLVQLWLPILVAAVAVFVASSLVHMVLRWHVSDYRQLPNEDDVRAVVRAGAPGPGQYFVPYCADPKEMGKPEMIAKFREGPVGMLVLRPLGPPTMGKALGLWFGLNLLVAILAGYLACYTLAAGSSFPQIFRVVGLFAFVAYAGGPLQQAVWMGKPWASAGKEVGDALIYGVVTGLAFGWLWPR
jgi:hypothetical protein